MILSSCSLKHIPTQSKSLRLTQMSVSPFLNSVQNESNIHLFSVAPMMDYTDRYQRYFQRLLTRYDFVDW